MPGAGLRARLKSGASAGWRSGGGLEAVGVDADDGGAHEPSSGGEAVLGSHAGHVHAAAFHEPRDDLSIVDTASDDDDDDDGATESEESASGSWREHLKKAARAHARHLAPARSKSFDAPKAHQQQHPSRRITLRVHESGVRPRASFPATHDLQALEEKAQKAASGWKAWIKGHRRAAAGAPQWVLYSFHEASKRDVASFNENEVFRLLEAHLALPQHDQEVVVLEKPFDLGNVEFPQGWGLLEFNDIPLRGLSTSEALQIISSGRQRERYRLLLCSPFVASILRHGHFRSDGLSESGADQALLLLLCMAFLEKHAPSRWHLFAESASRQGDDADFNDLHSALLRVCRLQETHPPLSLESVFSSRRDDHLIKVCRLFNVCIERALNPVGRGPLITIDLHDIYLADEENGPRQVLEMVLARTRDVVSLLSVLAFIRRLSAADEEGAIFFCCSLAPLIMQPEDPGLLRRLGAVAAPVTYEAQSAQGLYPLAEALAQAICKPSQAANGDTAAPSAIMSALCGDKIAREGRAVTDLEAAAQLSSLSVQDASTLESTWAAALLGSLVRHKLSEPLISPYLYQDVLLVTLTNIGNQVDCNFLLKRMLPFATSPNQLLVLKSLCQVINFISATEGAAAQRRLVDVFASCVFAPAAFPLTRKEHIDTLQRDRDAIAATFGVILRFADYILAEEPSPQPASSQLAADRHKAGLEDMTAVMAYFAPAGAPE